jgi:hypothetical protein
LNILTIEKHSYYFIKHQLLNGLKNQHINNNAVEFSMLKNNNTPLLSVGQARATFIGNKTIPLLNL